MKVKSIIKIIIDITMTGLFIALLFAYQTGLAFHEIMGLSILFLFVLHMILNGKWIVSVTKNLLSEKIKAKTFFMCLLNMGLLFGVLMVTVTGLLISKVLFPANDYNQTLVTFHKWTVYVTAGMMGVHLILHLKYLAVMFKKIFTGFKTSVVRRTLSSAAAIVFIAGIIYYNVVSATEKNMYSGITETTSSGQATENKYTVSDIPPDTSTTSEQAVTSAEETEKEENSEVITSSEPATETISLSEFLGKMFCNLCPKHCPLSHPQCGKSASLIRQATTEYNEQYSE